MKLPMPARPAPGPPRVPQRPRLSRRTVLRGSGGLAAVAVTGLVGACELRLGRGVPGELPTASAPEAARDSLARRAALIESTAQVVAGSQGGAAEAIALTAGEQLEALGGVWQPWPTAVPTDYPTVAPVATAAPNATGADLVAALSEGAQEALASAAACEDAATARLYVSLTVAWALSARLLDPAAAVPEGRSAATMSEPLPGDLLVAYDAARYALEEVGARSQGEDRARAVADASAAGDIVDASIALGGADTRLAAYGAPEAEDPATADLAWAQESWTRIMDAEIAGVGASGGGATSTAGGAALDAALRARSWGAVVDEALPGLRAS